MTDQPSEDRPTNTPSKPPRDEEAVLRAIPDLHVAKPLSTYLWGTLRVHFVGGGFAELEYTQADASRFERVVAGDEPSEPLAWSDSRWLTAHPDRIGLTEFEGESHWGEEYNREEKDVLQAKGYARGHLGALVNLWRDVREPSYSPCVVWLLRIVAVTSGVSHETFVRLASGYAGQDGAERGRDVWEQFARGESSTVLGPREQGKAEAPAEPETDAADEETEGDNDAGDGEENEGGTDASASPKR